MNKCIYPCQKHIVTIKTYFLSDNVICMKTICAIYLKIKAISARISVFTDLDMVCFEHHSPPKQITSVTQASFKWNLDMAIYCGGQQTGYWMWTALASKFLLTQFFNYFPFFYNLDFIENIFFLQYIVVSFLPLTHSPKSTLFLSFFYWNTNTRITFTPSSQHPHFAVSQSLNQISYLKLFLNSQLKGKSMFLN